MFQAQTSGIFESLLHLGRKLLQHNERTGQTMPAAAHKGSFNGLIGSREALKQFHERQLPFAALRRRAEPIGRFFDPRSRT